MVLPRTIGSFTPVGLFTLLEMYISPLLKRKILLVSYFFIISNIWLSSEIYSHERGLWIEIQSKENVFLCVMPLSWMGTVFCHSFQFVSSGCVEGSHCAHYMNQMIADWLGFLLIVCFLYAASLIFGACNHIKIWIYWNCSTKGDNRAQFTSYVSKWGQHPLELKGAMLILVSSKSGLYCTLHRFPILTRC